MDEPIPTAANSAPTLWQAAVSVIVILSGWVSVLARLAWNDQKDRLDKLEAACKTEHTQRVADLNQHAQADIQARSLLTQHLADEIRAVNVALADTRREIKTDVALIVKLLKGDSE